MLVRSITSALKSSHTFVARQNLSEIAAYDAAYDVAQLRRTTGFRWFQNLSLFHSTFCSDEISNTVKSRRRSDEWRGLKASGGCKSTDDCRSITKNQATYVTRSPNKFLKSTPLVGATGIHIVRKSRNYSMAGFFSMAGALEPAGEGLPGAGSGLAGISTESDESAQPQTPAGQITQRIYSNANEYLFTTSNSN